MKPIQAALPGKLVAGVEAIAEKGWFGLERELVRAAALAFVRRNRADPLEGSGAKKFIGPRLRRNGLHEARRLRHQPGPAPR